MVNYDEEIYRGAIAGGADSVLASFIVAQARHESANYSNFQFRQNNNPFGFKYSTKSKYATKGNTSPEGDAYAKYNSLQDAVKDYVGRWYQLPSKKGGTRLQEFNKYDTTEQYARGLKSYGYFADADKTNDEWEIQNYIRGINSALSKVDFSAFKTAVDKSKYYIVALIGVAMIAYTVFLIRKKKLA